MKKNYIFQRLTETVRHIAALMLIMLIAANSLFADEVTFVFADAGFSNGQVLPNGDLNGIISYSADRQSSGTDGPKYFNSGSVLRFYANPANALGNAMVLTPAFGYQITGLTINAISGYATPVGYVVDGGNAVIINADESFVYTITGIEAGSSLKFYNAATANSQLRITSITITYTTVEVPVVATPTFSVEPGMYYSGISLNLACATPGADILYTFNDSEYYTPYQSPISINSTTTVHAFAVLGNDTSAMAHATYEFPMHVSLDDFKNGVPGNIYAISETDTKMDFVFRNDRELYFMSENPFQPEGLLVYDNSPATITTQYEEGETVDMLVGTLSFFNGFAEMIPVTNPGKSVNSTPHTITPLEVTVSDLLSNPERYLSTLVVIKNGQFEAGTFTTNSKTGVNFVQDGSTIMVYNNFKTVAASFEGGEKASVVGLVALYNDVPQIFPRGNSDIVCPQIPYTCSFEGSEGIAWTIDHSSTNPNANKWYIGNANQLFDNAKLFVSNIAGINNVYNPNSASVSHAYIDITLPESDVLLSFDCRTVGNAEDFLQVSVMDEAPEEGVLPTNYLARFYNVNTFTRQTVLIPASLAGDKKIVFTWRNDNATGNQTPAAIDNVTMETTCSMVSEIFFGLNGHSVTVNWLYPEGQHAWMLQYKASDADAWQSLNTTSSSVTLNNLSTETAYDVRIRTICGTTFSAWKYAHFIVPCISTTTTPVELTIGNGTASTTSTPMHSDLGNSWTQMIYPSSNFATPGYINSLSWEIDEANALDYNSLKIYLGTSEMAEHANTNDWLPLEELTLVYERNNGTIGNTAGWETYILDNPYYYFENNLVVVVSRSSNNGNSLYYNYSFANNACLSRSADDDASYAAHPGVEPGVQNGFLPNMKIDYLSSICNDAHCTTPSEVNVQNITTNSAAISWTDNDANAWKVSYKSENASDWTTVNVFNNQCMLTGLTQNTGYEVRVMADCGINGMSDEAAASFTTVANCPAPTNLTVTHHQNNSVITWIPVLGVNNYELQYAQAGAAFWVSVPVNNASTFVLGGLAEGVTYNVRVRSVCDADEYSEWAELSFTKPNSCEAPAQLAISEITKHSANISLDPMLTNAWAIQYGESGFALGSGIIMLQNTYTAALTGLAAGTAYDLYVKAICDETSESVWAGPYTFTTEQDSVAEQASIPFIEPFNEGVAHDDWTTYHFDLTGFVVNDEVQGISISNGMYHNFLSGAENEYTMSPCLNIPAGRYDVAYSFKAIDQMVPEAFEVYLCTKNDNVINLVQQVAAETFSNTNLVRKHNFINVTEDGVYCFAIRSASPLQHLGFSMDDFAVKEVVNFTTTYAEHGTGTPEGLAEATKGELYTLTIVPQPGYHVSAIYKNMQLVSGANESNAAVQYYTFVPQNGDSIYVTFAASMFEVNATVSNLMHTEDNFTVVGAVYTPSHEMVAYGGSHTGILTLADHFHIHSVTVNGLDVTGNLVPVSASQYSLSLDNIVENKDIRVVAAFDDATIVYTVLAGQGTINGEFVADATTTPVTYTVTLPGNSDLLSTFIPAPGYHVSSVVIDGIEHSNIEIYSFEHLYGYHTVNVSFSKNHYTITTSKVGYGTVSAGVEFEYNPNYVYTFTATPDTGYRISRILRNHVEQLVENPTVGYSEVLTNITANYMYEVQFDRNVFTVTAFAGSNGFVSPAGISSYFYNQDAVYVINANQGFYIASLTIDGETTTYTQADGLTTTTHTFAQIAEDHSISATFAPMIFNVTVNAGENGAITPGSGYFALGATPVFSITPNEGYTIVDVIVDNESVGAVSTYVFTPLISNHTIAATFAASQFVITAMAGNGGTISDMGATTMAYNGSKTYTITPNAGFHVSNVFVDGLSVGAVSTYSFNNVTANHTIYAEFAANEYTITVTQPANGVITPGTTTVLNGATPAFVINPTIGYSVFAINVNGTNVISSASSVNDVYTYIFPAVSADQTITAVMVPKTFTISASAGANGSITPSGNATVSYGNTQVYHISPANGYVVENVMVDNMNMGVLNSYVFTNVVANHTIHVTFRPADCEIPAFMFTSHIDSTSAELHWSHPTATSFDIQYKPISGDFTTIPSVFGSSYLLTGLTPNTTYLWRVRANCFDNNQSEWSNMVPFTTEHTTLDETGIENLVNNQVKVYAERQNIHIVNITGLDIENVRIFDVYGKQLYSGSVYSSHEVVNLNVATGTYVVNVTTDKGIANYKVMIMK